MLRNYSHENGYVRKAHNIEGDEMVGQVARTIARMYISLEDHHADHQSIVVEVAGKIVEQSVSILIDPRSIHSYTTPRIVEICDFKKLKHNK